MENKKYTQQGIIDYINNLKGYQGYIQYSNRAIENIWTSYADISCDPKNGFVYEAHFFNGADSIAIRQVNGDWLVAITDISNASDDDKQTYHAINGLKVKMAQVWIDEPDENCCGMMVKKLKKVVFAGFEK